MKSLKVQIIGLGEIGGTVLKDMKAREEGIINDSNNKKLAEAEKHDIFGMDKDTTITTNNKIKEADVHIICVYTTDQVFEVLNSISYDNHPLISVESTIEPSKLDELVKWEQEHDCNIVLFPHRYNPGDDEHRCFNLLRVIGGCSDASLSKGLRFWTRYTRFAVPVSLKSAAIAKPLENAIRFVQIAMAEELKLRCDEMGIDFEDLAYAMNTKWNIWIAEPRDGIGGKCLPKDLKIANDFFDKKFSFLENARIEDEEYRERCNKK